MNFRNKVIKLIFYINMVLVCLISCRNSDSKPKNDYKSFINIKIDTLANRYLQLNRFSGTILVNKGDSLIYSNHFGLADYENNLPFTNATSFKIGGLSKLFTAKIIQKLISENKLKLEDSLSKYLPTTKTYKTIEDLINTDSLNINSNYNFLGELIEKISGESFQTNIDNYSKQIGLNNTYYKNDNKNLAIGYLFSNYRGKGNELHMSPSYNLQEAFSSFGIKSNAKDILKIIDYDKSIDIHGYIENDGFSYSVVNNPQTEISIIVLSNRRHPVTKEISNAINSIIEEKEYRLPLLRKPFKINTSLLKNYSGTYIINENISFDVVTENDSLFVLMGENKINLIPQSSNQFYMTQSDAAMRFIKDSTGIVSEVILLDGFLDGNSVKRVSNSSKSTETP